MKDETVEYDAIVIGTGFGGSATAARLVQAGARILVLERGMRYSGEGFPALPSDEQALPDSARYLWRSAENQLGVWDVRDLGALHSVQAAGYGGGSLLYANVQLRAPEEVFEQWRKTAGASFSRDELDPYYDVAAFMLDVRTLDEKTTGEKLYPVRKSNTLRAAAQHVGREAFYTPLAINLGEHDPPAPNKFGRMQRGCVACGECDSGCRHGAKNSLDHNYLAIVEDARDAHGQPLATIRTLAEVFAIERIESNGHAGPSAPRYRVRFHDHQLVDPTLRPARASRVSRVDDIPDEAADVHHREALAHSVFVCAGAVGSTELLLRSRERLGIEHLPIGRGFFGNSDALGVVFGTQHPQMPEVGPVITTALVHRGESGDEPWQMIQDGGYAKGVHALVQAVLGSPAWLARNRYRERDERGVAGERAPGDPEAVPQPKQPPQGKRRRNASLTEGFARVELAHELVDIIPEQLTTAGLAARARFEDFAAKDIEKTIDGLQRRLVERLSLHWSRFCKDTAAYPLVQGAFKAFFGVISSGIVRLANAGARVTEGEAHGDRALAVATREAIAERYGLRDQREVAVRAVAALAGYADPAAREAQRKHTAVLLGMGRDRQRHDLSLVKGEDGGFELTASIPDSQLGKARLYSDQERLMRELASALGGELRLNPAWSQAHTPITVHGQGGCAMSESPEHGVTDPHGQVHGRPGLYVMDASIFPSPVGVNPSATILAVCERNIEHYLREHFDPTRSQVERERRRAQREELAQLGKRYVDPRRASLVPRALEARAKTPKLAFEPVGIAFTERMFGFCSAIQNDVLDGTPRTEAIYSAYEACYTDGRNRGETLELKLDVAIKDLSAFLEDPGHVAELSGTLITPKERVDGRGHIQILAHHGKSANQRLFRYDLRFPRPGLPTLELIGHKRVRDEPGRDEWRDTTALFFQLREAGAPQTRRFGVARVSLDEFLFEQLPSMRVTGLQHAPPEPGNPLADKAPDAASVLWTMMRFGTFFFGSLASVYFKEAAFFTRLGKRAMSLDAQRDHVKAGPGAQP